MSDDDAVRADLTKRLESEYPPEMDLQRHGDTLHAGLWYPRSDETATYFQLALIDVRATDYIRISFDFDRNGWLIEQPTIFEWEEWDGVCDAGWEEVGFVGSRSNGEP